MILILSKKIYLMLRDFLKVAHYKVFVGHVILMRKWNVSMIILTPYLTLVPGGNGRIYISVISTTSPSCEETICPVK
jgi:hypothetical protein